MTKNKLRRIHIEIDPAVSATVDGRCVTDDVSGDLYGRADRTLRDPVTSRSRHSMD